MVGLDGLEGPLQPQGSCGGVQWRASEAQEVSRASIPTTACPWEVTSLSWRDLSPCRDREELPDPEWGTAALPHLAVADPQEGDLLLQLWVLLPLLPVISGGVGSPALSLAAAAASGAISSAPGTDPWACARPRSRLPALAAHPGVPGEGWGPLRVPAAGRRGQDRIKGSA